MAIPADFWDSGLVNWLLDPGFESGALRADAVVLGAGVQDGTHVSAVAPVRGSWSLRQKVAASTSEEVLIALIEHGWKTVAAAGQTWSFAATGLAAAASLRPSIGVAFLDAAGKELSRTTDRDGRANLVRVPQFDHFADGVIPPEWSAGRVSDEWAAPGKQRSLRAVVSALAANERLSVFTPRYPAAEHPEEVQPGPHWLTLMMNALSIVGDVTVTYFMEWYDDKEVRVGEFGSPAVPEGEHRIAESITVPPGATNFVMGCEIAAGEKAATVANRCPTPSGAGGTGDWEPIGNVVFGTTPEWHGPHTSASLTVSGRLPDGGPLQPLEPAAAGAAGYTGILGSPDGKFIYACSPNTGLIDVFSRDAETGALTFLEASAIKGDQGIAISPDGKCIYACAGIDLYVAARNPETGALTALQSKVAGEEGAEGNDVAVRVAVSPDGKHVYATNESSSQGGIWIYDRNSETGELTGIAIVDADRPTAYGLALTPDGAHLLVSTRHIGACELYLYARNSETGELTLIGSTALDNYARDVAVSPDGKHVYAACENNHLDVFGCDLAGGGLEPIEKAVPEGIAEATGVLVSPGGGVVYACGEAGITQFERDVESGALKLMTPPSVAAGADVPRLMAISADQRHLYLTEEHEGGAIRQYTRATAPHWPRAGAHIQIAAKEGDALSLSMAWQILRDVPLGAGMYVTLEWIKADGSWLGQGEGARRSEPWEGAETILDAVAPAETDHALLVVALSAEQAWGEEASWRMDEVTVTAGANVAPYADGSMVGWRWEGTAWRSPTLVDAAATLYIDEIGLMVGLQRYADGDTPGWRWGGAAGDSISVPDFAAERAVSAAQAPYGTAEVMAVLALEALEALATGEIVWDDLVLTQTAEAASYFSGDDMGAYWGGARYASPSHRYGACEEQTAFVEEIAPAFMYSEPVE